MLKFEPEFVTKGDALTLRIHVQEGLDGPGVDLTGATFQTSFPGAESDVVFDDTAHTLEDQTAPETKGWVDIAIATTDSDALKLSKFLAVVMKVTIGSVVTHHHGKINVLSPSPTEEVKPLSNILIGGCL